MDNKKRPIKALIADDDAGSLLILEYLIESLEIETASASDVAGAKKLLTGFVPDIAILDVLLPDGDGVDILLEIRRRQFPTAVALITASLQEFPYHKCGTVLPDMIFSKPVDHVAVSTWIEKEKARFDQQPAPRANFKVA